MAAWYRVKDWPLRAKMVALLFLVSQVPLAVALLTSINNARNEQRQRTEAVLTARGEELVAAIDTFNNGFLRVADRAAHIPTALQLLQMPPERAQATRNLLNFQLQIWPNTDRNIRGVAILDAEGTVVVGTEPRLRGVNLGHRSFVKSALAGEITISDIFVAEPEADEVLSVAYLAPVTVDGKIIGAAAIWVKASVLVDLVRASDGKAGPQSVAVLFDGTYIRMAHSSREELEFLPAVQLFPEQIDALVAEKRFGSRTRELLEDARQVGWQVDVPVDQLPDVGMFRGSVPETGFDGFLVGRRCHTTAWTVYQSIPARVLDAEMNGIVRDKMVLAVVPMLLALVIGLWFSALILRPVGALAAGARAIGAGNLATRVAVTRQDELGKLGATFNAMAARIQEQSEELKRESENEYRKLFESLTEAFCICEVIFDHAGRPVDMAFVDYNTAFERTSRLGDVRGKLRSEVRPIEDDFWARTYGQVVVTGEPVQFEHESKRLGRYFDVRAYRIGGPESRRVAALLEDITDQVMKQRRQQAELESLNLLHQITRAIAERRDVGSIFQIVVRTLEERLPADFVCICLYEPENDRLVVNAVGEKSLPLAAKLGLHEQSNIVVDGRGPLRCVHGTMVYQPDVGAIDYEFPQRLARGGLHALVAAPLLVESQVFGVLFTARRAGEFSSAECEFLRQLSEHVGLATHQNRLYTALQDAYRNLHQTQQNAMQQERLRALGQMASGIAHDINNAISPISLYTESLLERESGLSEPGRMQLQTIQRAIHDVAVTVARMREFYREREPQLHLAPVSLNDLVGQVVELTRARWSTLPLQRGVTIDLRTELQPDLPTIMGAENEIREALTNLMFNAVDAMPQGGRLTLSTSASGAGEVTIAVSDTGVGMDEDSRRRCLEPFFTTKGERGTGLGLAMVYGMAQRHSADIGIESSPGEGTTVRLTFLAADALPEATDRSARALPAPMKILLIDDDPVLVRSLGEILGQDGHSVVVAGDGRRGIEQARAAQAEGQPFSVVITDLGMPHVDGRQVAREIKEFSPQLPVILLTGWGQRLISEGDIPPHVDMILSKPPRLRELREALATCANLVTA